MNRRIYKLLPFFWPDDEPHRTQKYSADVYDRRYKR